MFSATADAELSDCDVTYAELEIQQKKQFMRKTGTENYGIWCRPAFQPAPHVTISAFFFQKVIYLKKLYN